MSPAFSPATPYGIVELLLRSGIELEGAEVVVVGYGELVGAPLSIMLAQDSIRGNATVTICHIRTRDLASQTRRADILVAAAGKPQLITGDMVKPGAVVVDVGVHRTDDGLVGDVRFDEVKEVAGRDHAGPRRRRPDDDRDAPAQHRHRRGSVRRGAVSAEPRLRAVLGSRAFAVTSEVVPPRSADPAPLLAQARALVGYADAVNVTDNPAASVHMSPLAGAAIVSGAGLEPTLQLTVRDRNRLALAADLLGGWALGARNVLCLTGDPLSVGDHPEAAAVNDLGVLDLVRMAARLRDEGRLPSGASVEPAPRYLVGVADSPLADAYDPARLEVKLDAGADVVMTQIVYDVDALEAWADVVRSRGVLERASVLVGIAPVRSARQARYLDEQLPGVSVPPRDDRRAGGGRRRRRDGRRRTCAPTS